jgi:hypothetical protein
MRGCVSFMGLIFDGRAVPDVNFAENAP